MMTSTALKQYQQTNITTGVAYADPHTLIAMLFQGFRERIAIAKGAILRADYAVKGRAIGRAIDILNYLQNCLDLSKGGDLAENLDALYDYMIRRLFRASMENNMVILNEVNNLAKEVETGWLEMRGSIQPAKQPVYTLASR